MKYQNSMWGDYSPTPAVEQIGAQIEVDNAPEMAVTAQQMATDPSCTTTEDMMAAMGTVPGFNNADGNDVNGKPNSVVEGDVGGARPQS